MNWDAHYVAMARAFLEHVQTGAGLSMGQLETARAIVGPLVRGGSGDPTPLGELAVAWVSNNPTPVPLPTPTYKR